MINIVKLIKDLMKLRNSGFSLLQVMVAIGLAGGVSLIIMKNMELQKQNQRTTESQVAIMDFMSEFKNYFNIPGVCKSSLNELSFENKTNNISTIINENDNEKYIEGGYYQNNKVILKKMTISNLRYEDKLKTTASMDFKLKLEKTGKVYGSKTISKSFSFLLQFDLSNKFYNCGLSLTPYIDQALVAKVLKSTTKNQAPDTNVDNSYKAAKEDRPSDTNLNIEEKSVNNSLVTEVQVAKEIIKKNSHNEKIDIADKKIQEAIDANPTLKALHSNLEKIEESNKILQKLLDEDI